MMQIGLVVFTLTFGTKERISLCLCFCLYVCMWIKNASIDLLSCFHHKWQILSDVLLNQTAWEEKKKVKEKPEPINDRGSSYCVSLTCNQANCEWEKTRERERERERERAKQSCSFTLARKKESCILSLSLPLSLAHSLTYTHTQHTIDTLVPGDLDAATSTLRRESSKEINWIDGTGQA